MARVAGCREPRGNMGWVGRALVVRHVADGTRAAGQGVIIVDVALHALQRSVSACQREARRRVIKVRVRPGNRVMACLAGLREIGLHVIGGCRTLEILQVA